MNVLYLTPRNVLPLNGGAEIGSLGLIKTLKRIGFRTTLLSFYDDQPYNDDETNELLKYVSEIKSIKFEKTSLALSFSFKYPNSIKKYTKKEMMALLNEQLKLKDYQFVVSDHLQMFEYCKTAKHIKRDIKIILNEHNVEYLIWKNYSTICNFLIRPFVSFNAIRMKHYEADACRKAYCSLVVSEKDKQSLLHIAPDANIISMLPPTFFELTKFQEDFHENHNTLLFVGNYAWYPNVYAAMDLIKEIMPRLRERLPFVKLYLVGNKPTKEMLYYSSIHDDIIVTGKVASLEQYYREADVFINPVSEGGGINIKTLEAIGRGIPLVSSEFGVRGIKDNNCIAVYRNYNDCVDKIIDLLRNKTKALNQAKEARLLYDEIALPDKDLKPILLGNHDL